LVPPDTVRIDSEVLLQWNDLYGDREIREVDVELSMDKQQDASSTHKRFQNWKERAVIQTASEAAGNAADISGRTRW